MAIAVALPRHHAARRRARRGGARVDASPRSCTSRSGRPAGGPPPRRCAATLARARRRRRRRARCCPTQPTHRDRDDRPATPTASSRVRVLGRDEADAQLLSKFWRVARSTRTAVRRCTRTRLEDVEAQAYALLLAERAGVRVPPVVVAGTAGPGAALIASRPLAGQPPAPTSIPRTVTDAHARRPLAAGRGAARGTRRARPAQRQPRRRRRHDASASPTSSYATGAAATGTPRRRRRRAAREHRTDRRRRPRRRRGRTPGWATTPIVEALPYLQPAALSRELRTDRRHRKERSKEVGDASAPPPPRRPAPTSRRSRSSTGSAART